MTRHDEPVLDVAELIARYGVSRRQLHRWMHLPGFPSAERLRRHGCGPKLIWHDEAALHDWIAMHRGQRLDRPCPAPPATPWSPDAPDLHVYTQTIRRVDNVDGSTPSDAESAGGRSVTPPLSPTPRR